MRQRAAQINHRNAWKTQGTGAKLMSGGHLWGRNLTNDPSDIPINITGVSRGCRPGELFYSLSTPDIGGVFLLREHASDELRLLHSADFRVRRPASSVAQESLACVVQRKGCQSSIAVMRADGTDMHDVTGAIPSTTPRTESPAPLASSSSNPPPPRRIRGDASSLRDSQA